VFIEPKGEIYAKAEPWKGEFLEELEKKAQIERNLIMEAENKDFKLIGLPFYNEKLRQVFQDLMGFHDNLALLYSFHKSLYESPPYVPQSNFHIHNNSLIDLF
jgi:hypothetical protein